MRDVQRIFKYSIICTLLPWPSCKCSWLQLFEILQCFTLYEVFSKNRKFNNLQISTHNRVKTHYNRLFTFEFQISLLKCKNCHSQSRQHFLCAALALTSDTFQLSCRTSAARVLAFFLDCLQLSHSTMYTLADND